MIPVSTPSIAAGHFTRTLLSHGPTALPAFGYGPRLTPRTRSLLDGLAPLVMNAAPDRQAVSSLRGALQQEAEATLMHSGDDSRASLFALGTADQALARLAAFREQHPPAPLDGDLSTAVRPEHLHSLRQRFRASFERRPAPEQYLLAAAIEPSVLSTCGVTLSETMAPLVAARREGDGGAVPLNHDELLALFDAVNTPELLPMINAALALDRYGFPDLVDTLRPLASGCCGAVDKLHRSNDWRVALVQMDCGPVGTERNGVDPTWLAQSLQQKTPVQMPLILASSTQAPPATGDGAHLVVECSGADVSAFCEQAGPGRQVWMPLGLPVQVTGQWPSVAEEGLPARYIARTQEAGGSWYFNDGLWPAMPPRPSSEVNDNTPIGPEHGVQSRAIGEGRFQDVVISPYDVRPNKYLFTVDARGINIVLERTATANPRGMVLHSNLSARALAAGEVWFLSEDTVQINNGSVRFGVRNSAQWDAVAKLWQQLGYRVRQVGFKRRFGPEETLDIKVLAPPEEL